jgi:hypothetical protein
VCRAYPDPDAPGGGYGVDVVTSSGAIRLVGVTTGMYSRTLVQISGSAISAGTLVEVLGLWRNQPTAPQRGWRRVATGPSSS